MESVKKPLSIVSVLAGAMLVTSPIAWGVPVSNTTAAAASIGSVPIFFFDFLIDVQPSLASADVPVSNGTETADGAAQAQVDLSDINSSTVNSESKVSTAGAPTLALRMLDLSVAGYTATVMTEGPAPAQPISLDLQIDLTGSLIYTDPGGTASSSFAIDPFDPANVDVVPDMASNVSLIVAIADVFQAIETPPPDPLPFVPLFNGSVSLESTNGSSSDPILVREGDWEDASRDGDFMSGGCDPSFCQVDIDMSLLLQDVDQVGIGDVFDVGIVLFTGVHAISGTDRAVESDFFGTGGIGLGSSNAPDVRFVVIPSSSTVPEPGTLPLLAAALVILGLWAARDVSRRGRGLT